ncbi:MAG: hypothetical protein R6U61_05630 [Thermoplasmata archaeon]
MEKKIYWLVLLPSAVLSYVVLVYHPFKIVDSRYGWTYETTSSFFGPLIFFYIFILMFIAVLVGLYILRRINISMERRRVKLIIIAVGVIYLGGMGVTNFFLINYPNSPPCGGILTTAEFIVIAYAISLPSIKVHSEGGADMEDLHFLYLDFFREFQQNIPDERFGKAEIFLKESLEVMGLDHIIKWDEKGRIYVDPDGMESSDIGELVDTTLKGLKLLDANLETLKSFSSIVNFTYVEIEKVDPGRAEEWREDILNRHGPFLNEKDILQHIEFVEEYPEILEDIKEENILIKPKDKPLEIYDELESIHEFGYDVKCITKYSSDKITSRTHCDPSDIVEIMKYVRGVKNRSFESKFLRDIRKHWRFKENTVLVIDCLDILTASLGTRRSFDLMEFILRKAEGYFVLAYNQEILREEGLRINELKRV